MVQLDCGAISSSNAMDDMYLCPTPWEPDGPEQVALDDWEAYLMSLPPIYQDILIMRVQGKTVAAIAESLNVDARTVLEVVARAKRRFSG